MSGGVAQVIKCLPSKHKTNPNTEKKSGHDRFAWLFLFLRNKCDTLQRSFILFFFKEALFLRKLFLFFYSHVHTCENKENKKEKENFAQL
jgi:hypothetical protein